MENLTVGGWGRAAAGLGAFSLALLFSSGLAIAACRTTPTSHCLQGGRFSVSVDWQGIVNGEGGAAGTVAGATADSGLFFFYGPNNWEILVKVLDACSQNDHYWVFAASATTFAYTITVTDTVTGAVRTYSNRLGVPSPAITDTEAFATCGGRAQGAQVRYYNASLCNGTPFTSTFSASGYGWQSFTEVPSAYQLVQRPDLGPPLVETNDGACGGSTVDGRFSLAYGRRYAIANTATEFQLLDEGSAVTTGAEASPAAAPAGRIVQRLAKER